MSSTLNVYLVSFDELRKVPGSKNQGLIAAVGSELEYFLSQIDDLRDEEDDVPTCREAVAQIVEGEPLAEHLGYLYGYAFEAICAYLGRELPNIPSICGTAAWINEVDELLRSRGVPISLSDLIFGVCPIRIPTPDDCPFIGSWPPESIPGALEAIRLVDVVGLDYDMAETVTQIADWLETAAASSGKGLIGFLS